MTSRLISVGPRKLVCSIVAGMASLVRATTAPAKALEKMSKQEAEYQDSPKASACVPPAPSSNLRNRAKLSKATSARADGARRLRSQINLWVRGGTPDLDNSWSRGP
jgi:hypothetical protein